MATVTAPLHTEELQSLHVLSAAARQNGPVAIAPAHRDKLLGYGYAADFCGTLAITPVGQAKLVYETTRANWFPTSESGGTKQ